jgi:putative tributyrin esterase
MTTANQGSRFLQVELSDPAFERDHVRSLTVFSPALRGRGDVSLFGPPGCNLLSNVPLVILLPGVYSSHWAWFLRGGVHRTALELIETGKTRPMLIASPSDGLDGQGTAYVCQREKDYESWICDDVIDCVRDIFPCTGPHVSVFIAGLSMGGYGALRLGAKYPAKFKGISAHSAITRIEQMSEFVREPFWWNEIPSHELDIVHWFRLNRSTLSPLRFDCGRDDLLMSANRSLQADLRKYKIPHRFFEYEGDHSWPYWRTHIADSLLFFEEILLSNTDQRSTEWH